MKTVTIKINGMMCPHCSGRVKNVLMEYEGVTSADVSHERADAIIECSEATDVKELERLITEAGYEIA